MLFREGNNEDPAKSSEEKGKDTEDKKEDKETKEEEKDLEKEKEKVKSKKKHPIVVTLAKITSHNYFSWFMNICIMVNTVFMAMYHHEMSDTFVKMLGMLYNKKNINQQF